MPPRYAYWTILVDGQPTAFRAAMQEDLMPTFKRLQQKHPSAEMKWFQNGKLWTSRVDAQEAMRDRGERGRMGDKRQGGGFRDRKRSSSEKLEWQPKGPAPREPRPEWKQKRFAAEGGESRRSSRPASGGGRGGGGGGKLDWRPKGDFTPAPKRSDRGDRPDWKPKSSFDRERKPEWKPKGSFDRERKPEWKQKGSFDRERKPAWTSKKFAAEGSESRRSSRPASGGGREGGPRTSGKLDWTPKSGHTGAKPAGAEKRKWVPKADYKKSQGVEARRDKNWRPGGEHKDPRQKYKDAKKAKWTKFKTNIRQRWEKKAGTPARRSPKGEGGRPPKKRRDEE